MSAPLLSMIAAIGSRRELGLKNKLLWNIPEDMKRFRTLTRGHAIIMGQKTYESIGRPLPDRINIVLTLDRDFAPEGVRVCYTLDEALALAREVESEEIFVIGGGSIYRQFLPLADRLYLTLVEGEFEADVFFPEYGEFTKVREHAIKNDEQYRYEFVVLER